jgi:hypothetical protein
VSSFLPALGLLAAFLPNLGAVERGAEKSGSLKADEASGRQGEPELPGV